MTIPNSTRSDNAAFAAEPKAMAEETAAAPPLPGQPATRAKQGSTQQSKQNKMVLLAGGAAAIVLLAFILVSFPVHKGTVSKPAVGRQQVAANQSGENHESDEKSLFPITESGQEPIRGSQDGLIGEQDVQRTAMRQTVVAKSPESQVPAGATLGSIPPFDGDPAWQAPPNQSVTSSDEPAEVTPKREHDQPSLVFVHKEISPASNNLANRDAADFVSGLGLPTGTRLRARLEAAASTAVRTPVIAVIEYNYEKDGEIIVPAGAKAFGRIEQADRSGYLSIRFDSLLMPDGSSTSVDAVATDLRLRPIKGKVEGKNTGKNVLIRSLSGIGQVGAVLAGRSGGLNAPLSEGDLVRERLSTNIGESTDQEISRLTLSERVVVSVDANTPIYVVLDRGTKEPLTPAVHGPASTTQSLDSLRQLLQLQRELNQNAETISR